jgi:hypothetical protein
MACYTSELNRTGTTADIGCVEAPAASMRRLAILKAEFAIDATPGDTTLTWVMIRTSTASTGTTVTPSPVNPADAACVGLTKDVITAPGTTGVILESVPLNQRATYTWVAYGEGELIIAATALAGILLRNSASSSLTATATITFRE